jgi:hypothetical protein
MKIYQILFLVLIVLSSCTKSKEENAAPKEEKVISVKGQVNPEDLGKEVFNIVSDFDGLVQEDFNKKVITYQELQNLANNPKAKLGEHFRADFKSITSDIYEEVMQRDYNSIKDAAASSKINLDKIEFVTFVHKLMEFDEVKGVLGETYFKNTDDKVYFVKSMAFHDGEKYVLVKVEDIEPSKQH